MVANNQEEVRIKKSEGRDGSLAPSDDWGRAVRFEAARCGERTLPSAF
jgi:hypothetical protein